ncbi:MAG: ATP-binding protein, partial [Victivallaceae bacterium]|nr:ATP-binding protein [Victivallaceae bacterium]
MLISFSCANFLSIKEEKTLSLVATPTTEFQKENVFKADRYRLLKSAVIYGANASGKSNLLSAMNKMRSLVLSSSKESQAKEELRISEFKLSTSTIGKPSKFEICFLLDEMKYRYGFEADNKRIKSEWLLCCHKIKEEPLFFREDNDIKVFDKFKEGRGLEKRTRENALFLSVCAQFNVTIAENLLKWFTKFNIISGLQDKKYQRFSEDMFMKHDSSKKMIVEFMKKADLAIQDISVEHHDIDESIFPAEMSKEVKEMFMKKGVNEVSTTHNIYDNKANIIGKTNVFLEEWESEGTKKYFRLSGPIL